MRRILLSAILTFALTSRANAYVEAPMSLGAIVQQSVCICSMVITKVDKTNNIIVYQKVADLKGKHPQETIKHNIGRGGLRPGEWKEIMDWAEVGKTAIFCHNGGASETFIGVTWYQAYPNGDAWGMSHGEPFLLRSFAGKQEKLAQAVKEIVAGKEIVVSCMADGDKEALHKKTAKMQKLRVSLKLLDYNPKRDFVGWGGGGDEIRRYAGMPGFDKIAGLGKSEADAQAITVIDFDGDGKPDICLCGANKVTLLQQSDDGFNEVSLPGLVGGARSAMWADVTGDGLPDVLLATPNGARLYVNLGKGAFRDDTRLLPKELLSNLTAAAFGDFDNDGKPDILLADGFQGLRLWKNIRKDATNVPKITPPKAGAWSAIGPFRVKDTPQLNYETAFSPEAEISKAPDLGKVHKGKRDIDTKWEAKQFTDGQPNDLAPYGANCATYLYRELDCEQDMVWPVALGSSGSITVWLNGVKIFTEKIASRPAAADQTSVKLPLKKGKNLLWMKYVNDDQPNALYFQGGVTAMSNDPLFEDATAAWGLGDAPKGDALCVADFDNNGKLDFLYSAGTGMVYMNTGSKFELKDVGISFATGKVNPTLGDFDNDGHIDLFVPQMNAASKLYRNKGNGTFEDVTSRSPDLAKSLGLAVGASWGDFNNDGKPDLVMTCLKGTNRYFQQEGDGKFVEQSAKIGLNSKVFNSQSAAFADMNGDGQLDLVLINEGQESCVLYGKATETNAKTPVLLKNVKQTPVKAFYVRKPDGLVIWSNGMSTANGRGGQGCTDGRCLLDPGEYVLVQVVTNGPNREQTLKVEKSPLKITLE